MSRLPSSLLVFLKILFLCCFISGFVHFLRSIVPSYNGEDVYFPVHEKNSEKLNNQRRLEEINKFLNEFNWKIFERAPFSNIAVGVIASNRGGDYLLQSVGYFLKHLRNRTVIPQLNICNVEPTSFPQLEFFKNKIPIYSVNSFKNLSQFNLNVLEGRIQKEASDYWKCLQMLTNLNQDYLLLLEDDAVVIPHFFTLMDSLISQLNNSKFSHVDYVKLFHPWYLRKIPFIFQAMSFSIIFSTLLVYLFTRRFLIILILILTVVCYLNFKFLHYELLADIRFHISSSSYLIPPESCCTPAVLFRRRSAVKMIDELSSEKTHEKHAKDHILDESRFFGRGTDFNYIVHIGHFSSIRQKEIPLEALRKLNL